MKPPNRAPFYACLYHGLCDIARAKGYALAIHGSVTTDLDLIAIPWTEEAVSAVELKDALMEHIGACTYEEKTRQFFGEGNEDLVRQVVVRENEKKEIEDETGATIKPHGRRAWNLYMDFGAKVDLSVMSRLPLDKATQGG